MDWFLAMADNQQPRVQRNMRDLSNPFEKWNERQFIQRYRLDKHSVRDLMHEIEPQLIHSRYNDKAIPMPIQMCAALLYLAKGDMQRTIGDTFGISQPSVSNCIRVVTRALADLMPIHIYMPNDEEKAEIMGDFFRKYELPGIIGLIDGTHIRLKKPREFEYAYVNRRSYHSINVQIVIDSKHLIRDVVARFVLPLKLIEM